MNIFGTLLLLCAAAFFIEFFATALQPSFIDFLKRLFPREPNGRLSMTANVCLSAFVCLITAATIWLIVAVKWPK